MGLISTDSNSTQLAPGKRAAGGRIDHLWVIILLFSLGIFLTGQLQFSTHDDWSYGWTVKHLAETGEFRYLAAFASAIPLIISGLFAVKVFGFSFQVLHNVSAFYSVLSACGLFLTVFDWTKSRVVASICASTVLFNPILVNLSAAFMTDPAAIAFMTWTIWAATRTVRQKNIMPNALLLVALIIAGSLTRQSSIVMMPIAASTGIALFKSSRKASIVLLTSIPLQVLVMIAVDNFMMSNMQFPEDSLRIKYAVADLLMHWLHEPAKFAVDAWLVTAKVMAYLGPFCFPVIVWKLPQVLSYTYPHSVSPGSSSLKLASFSSLLMALITVLAPLTYLSCFCNQWMPYFPNFWDFPRTGYYICFSNPDLRTEVITQYWTFACSFAGTVLAWTTGFSILHAVTTAKHSKSNEVLVLLTGLVCCLAWMFLCSVIQGLTLNYDRYLIPLLVPFVLLNCIDLPWHADSCSEKVNEKDAHQHNSAVNGPTRAALIAATFMGVYSFTALYDSVNFHKARWMAAEHMELLGVRADELDVGPDYLFWKVPATYSFCNPPSKMFSFRKNPITGEYPLGAIRGWPILNEQYVLNPEFNPYIFDGFRPVYRQPFFSPWTWSENQILVLKKDPSQHTGEKQWIPPD